MRWFALFSLLLVGCAAKVQPNPVILLVNPTPYKDIQYVVNRCQNMCQESKKENVKFVFMQFDEISPEAVCLCDSDPFPGEE